MGRKLVVILTSLIIFAAAQAKALGLGDITLESALNQPLSARIELLEMGGVRAEDIRIQLASNSDFQRFSIERPFFLENIRFAIESSGNRSFVTLSTTEVVREPYLSFVLEASWPNGRLLSEYTVLMDLPVFGSQSVLQTAQAPARSVVESPPEQVVQNQQIAQDTSSDTQRNISRAAAADSTQASAADPVAGQPEVTADNEITEPPPEDTDSGATQDVIAEETIPEEAEPTVDAQAVVEENTPLPEPVRDAEPEPARFASQTEAASGQTVTVEAADTLWDIALEVRPDSGVSVQQTMLALQRLNSDAFIGNNINLIRRGQVLRVPDLNEILAITQQQAVAEVSQQNQLFADRRNAPVSSQPLTAPPAAQDPVSSPGTGELSVVTSDSQDSTSGDTSGAGSEAARIAELENAAAVSTEETDRLTLQNNELTARLTMLEEQIASAQEIIRLRDLELAQLQESLAAQTQDAGNTATEPAAIVTMAPEQGATSNLLNTLLSNTYAIIAAVLFIILLLVFVLLRRNRAAQETEYAAISELDSDAAEDEQFHHDSADQPFTSLDEEEFEQTRYTDYRSESDAHDDDLEELDKLNLDDDADEEFSDVGNGDDSPVFLAKDGDNILDQADAFIAYERLDEAQALLHKAIDAEPGRRDLRLKLLEVYVASGDTESFQQQEAELEPFADDETLVRIENLRAQLPASGDAEIASLSDNNDFYNINELGEEAEDDSAFEADAPRGLESADAGSNANRKEAGASAVNDDDDDFDFDFDLADLDAEPATAPVSEKSDEPGAGLLSDDLELEGLAGDPDDEQDSDDVERVDLAFDEEDDDADSAIEFNIDDLSVDDTVSGDEANADPVESVEFNIDDQAYDAPEPDSPAADSDVEAVEFENLEFVSAEEDTNAEDDYDADEDISFLTDSDEAATKLDLARAYIDMGDKEGATEILEEVLDEGTEAQIRDAKSLLERIQ